MHVNDQPCTYGPWRVRSTLFRCFRCSTCRRLSYRPSTPSWSLLRLDHVHLGENLSSFPSSLSLVSPDDSCCRTLNRYLQISHGADAGNDCRRRDSRWSHSWFAVASSTFSLIFARHRHHWPCGHTSCRRLCAFPGNKHKVCCSVRACAPAMAVVTGRSMKPGHRNLDTFTIRHCFQPTLSLSLVSTYAPSPCPSLTNHVRSKQHHACMLF
jgi:hypothetical protein